MKIAWNCWIVLLATGLSLAGDVPPRSQAGQTLEPTKSDLDTGEIYHIYPGEDTQLAATSDAQLQRIGVTCRRIVGYFVAPFDRAESDPPIVRGYGRIPVASLDTGSSALNDILRSAVLGADKSPEIEFAITSTRDTRKTSKEKEPATYSLTLVGQVMIKGKPVDVAAPATVTLLPFTFRTMARYPGDILTVRAALDLKLADLGIEKPGREWADKIADSVRVDLFLLANTVSPEKSLDPALKQPHNIRHMQFMTRLRDFDDPAAAYELGRKFMKEVWDDPAPLIRLAGETAAEDGIRTRDWAFALEAAQRACELSKNENAAHLDTLARVQFERGDLSEALRVQKIAVEKSAALPPPVAQSIKDALAKYERQLAARSK